MPVFRLLSSLAFAAALASCASAPRQAEPVSAPQRQEGDANTHLVIAEIALQRRELATAAREYANAADLVLDAALAEQATRVAFEHRQYTAAVRSARRWLELEPASDDARRFLAVVSLRLFDLKEAARQFGYLLDHGYPTPAAGFMDLTATLADEDSAYALLALMRELTERHAELPEAHYAVAVAALRTYHYGAAVAGARRALELRADFAEAERVLGRALMVSGATAEALALARARAAVSTASQDRLEVGILLAASDAAEAARAELTPLLQIDEAKPEALRTLANIELDEERFEAAAEHFTELLTTGRYVSLAFYSLGAIHERQREAVRAIRYYTRITGGPYASDAQLRAARLLVANGAREQANGLLDAFVREHPQHEVEIAIGRARLLGEEGDSAAALALLEAAQRLYPDVHELLYARSVALEQAGRVQDTIAQLRAALERRPEDPVALNALGYTLAEHKKNLREAESLVRRALEKTPDNPAVQDSYGWVLHRLGREEEALRWLEAAYAAQRDAEIAAHIGEVYWAMGERGRAREIWQTALADEPNHRYLLRTLRRYPE